MRNRKITLRMTVWKTDKQEELDRNLQWGDCPEEFKQQILDVVMEHWDAFDNDGMKHPIRNFVANIDTGTCKPVCCKPPHYGPHETKIMEQLVDGLERNGLIEDDDLRPKPTSPTNIGPNTFGDYASLTVS